MKSIGSEAILMKIDLTVLKFVLYFKLFNILICICKTAKKSNCSTIICSEHYSSIARKLKTEKIRETFRYKTTQKH